MTKLRFRIGAIFLTNLGPLEEQRCFCKAFELCPPLSTVLFTLPVSHLFPRPHEVFPLGLPSSLQGYSLLPRQSSQRVKRLKISREKKRQDYHMTSSSERLVVDFHRCVCYQGNMQPLLMQFSDIVFQARPALKN